MQTRLPYFTLATTMFVMMPLIILWAPLVLFWLHNTWTTFNAWINLPLAWNQSLILELPSKCKPFLLTKMPSFFFFLKSPKILSQKRCVDDMSKHIRWLAQILQSLKPNMKRLKWTYITIHKMMHSSHTSHEPRMCAFYNWASLDFQSTKRIISGKILQSLQKRSQSNIWIWLKNCI